MWRHRSGGVSLATFSFAESGRTKKFLEAAQTMSIWLAIADLTPCFEWQIKVFTI